MSWNAPQTVAECLKSVRHGFSFQSRLGIKAENIWVLTDISKAFHNVADDFSQDLIRRNWTVNDRYTRLHTREQLPEDLVYVTGRDGVLLVGILRDGTILRNERSDLPKRLQTYRDAAAEELRLHMVANGHLSRTDS